VARSGDRATTPPGDRATITSDWRGLLAAACRRLDHPLALSMVYGEAGFAILLPDCDRQRAAELGNQLIRQFQQLAAAKEGEPARRLRLGAGVASVTLPPKNFSTADLLEAAGRCLFGSHASGGGVKSIEIY